MGEVAVILDASAFISGFQPASKLGKFFTVPEVEEELSQDSISRIRFKAAIESGEVQIRRPSRKFLDMARRFSREVGDAQCLSPVDLELIALALELRELSYQPLIITDDYAIQNVANQAGVEYAPLSTLGITHRLYWTLYCPACCRRFPPDYPDRFCRFCGTELKRKPSKRVPVR